MTEIWNETYPQERALYGAREVCLQNCRFEGAEDGESALKEARDVELRHCHMALRYPFWHCGALTMHACELTAMCRAALWYATDVAIHESRLHGIKALRECQRVRLVDSDILSDEFGWKCHELHLENNNIEGEYLFLDSDGIDFLCSSLKGKYSFQYVENVRIDRCQLDTKDAFWHSRNVTVRDSTIRGEYLGWYSQNLTLERCHIIGTQPLCYAQGLTLRDCTMEACDLAFEYSDVEATIRGRVDSVKNPRSGRVQADCFGEILFTPDAVCECKARVVTAGGE